MWTLSSLEQHGTGGRFTKNCCATGRCSPPTTLARSRRRSARFDCAGRAVRPRVWRRLTWFLRVSGARRVRVMLQGEGPAWFQVNARFLRGVEYLCNSGFTRASAPAPGGASSARADSGAGPETAASVVVTGVLSQVDYLLACTHGQAAAELKGLRLPDDRREVPAFSLNLREDSAPASAGQGAAVEIGYIETLAEEEDEDDFVFESLEDTDASQKGFLCSLLPAESTDSPPLTGEALGNDAQARFRGWENGGECLRKLLMMAKVVTYARVAAEWHALQVNDILLRIVQRLLQLPPALWQQSDTAVEEANDEQVPAAGVEGRGGRGHAAAALLVHTCFLIRHRVCNEPNDGSEGVLALLQLFVQLSARHQSAEESDGPRKQYGDSEGLSLLGCLLVHICAAAVGVKDDSSSASPDGADGESGSTGLLASMVSEEGAVRARSVWGNGDTACCDGFCRFLAARISAAPPPRAQGNVARDSRPEAHTPQDFADDAALASEERLVCAVCVSMAVAGAGQGGVVGAVDAGGSCALVRSGLLRALVHREVLMIRARCAVPAADGADGSEEVCEGSASVQASRRLWAGVSCVRRDALMMMCANSEEITSYIARVPEFRARDKGDIDGRAGAGGGVNAGSGACVDALSQIQRAVLDLSALAHGVKLPAKSNSAVPTGNAAVETATNILTAWLGRLDSVCLETHDQVLPDAGQLPLIGGALDSQGQEAEGMQGTDGEATVGNAQEGLALLSMLQAVLVTGNARMRLFKKVLLCGITLSARA